MRPSIRSVFIPVLLLLTCLAALPSPALAQSPGGGWEVGGQLAHVRSSEFDDSDVGIGGRLAWFPATFLGLEGELDAYRSDFPDRRERTRLEGLFGVTVGPQLGRLRPFAKVRAGFLRYPPASEAILCVAVYPPPLGCTLAGGQTVTAYDIGGGVQGFVSRRAFIRVDLSDRLLRYPGPALRAGGKRTDGASFGHDLRLSFGAGWRF